jgi:hypothetical protein
MLNEYAMPDSSMQRAGRVLNDISAWSNDFSD